MSNPEDKPVTGKGACHCGGVAFEVRCSNPNLVFCHCEDCRKTTGHVHAAIGMKAKNMTLTKDSTLVWYESTKGTQRGFCSTCGGNLFWKRDDKPFISVQAGMLDQPTGLSGGKHYFVGEKGDYYDITDDLPQVDKW